MKRLVRTALILGVAAISLKGCIFNTEVVPPGNPGRGYAPQTAPESVVVNLQVSYRRQEIEEYAKLLAPEFIFKFQTLDYDEVPKGFWTHDEDSVGTASLFKANEVQQIRIELLGLPAEPSVEVDHPPGVVKIRIASTDLQVDTVDGISYVAQDEQDMFFRRGLASANEDTTHWFLYEWRDLEIGGSTAPGGPAPLSAGESRPLTLQRSWGSIMQEALKQQE